MSKKQNNPQHNLSCEAINFEDKALLYQNDAIDFLGQLPDNSVDLIITDPAFSRFSKNSKHRIPETGFCYVMKSPCVI